ncbi:MAG: DUF2330 domain-containing protein [Bacteroidia bacterium]|jgi:hypothetical protein|nr:DUF2330 domain-containing protein [Bacteroidia bacterium]
MKKIIPAVLAAVMFAQQPASAFCGFYVAKTDATLLNKASQVIVTRDGNRNVVTMSSDFQGDVKDFAMVVPVPVVLKRNQIRVKERSIFEKFNDYTAPRMAEYYDPEICPRTLADTTYFYAYNFATTTGNATVLLDYKSVQGVKVEAQYKVDEYDVVILSATESGGLKTWLLQNGYKIPDKAEEVLNPYIASNMKFFVVKANMDEIRRRNPYVSNGVFPLRPIQIEFESPKFMLPIRLGMANATESQDMVVYLLSRKGRIETTNYRTVGVPTNMDVPVFVADKFTDFYHKVYQRALNKNERNAVFLEYAWDVTPQNPVPCDPCVGTPLYVNDLHDAGASWASVSGPNTGQVYITRLHVTYDRAHYPQDLMFQETPNRENFQARYVRHIPPRYSGFSCYEGQRYLRQLNERRLTELENYKQLTGENASGAMEYLHQFDNQLRAFTAEEKARNEREKQNEIIPTGGGSNHDNNNNLPMLLLSILTLTVVFFALSRTRLTVAS